MTTLNNAQIQCLNGTAVYDYELVDAEQKIWKGKVICGGRGVEQGSTIYFSRHYDRKNSDLDKMIYEYEIENESLIGADFLIIPREKLMFLYTPPSTIVIPNVKLTKGPQM